MNWFLRIEQTENRSPAPEMCRARDLRGLGRKKKGREDSAIEFTARLSPLGLGETYYALKNLSFSSLYEKNYSV